MNYLPFLIVIVALAGLMALTARNRRRALATQSAQAEAIVAGTDVMTTSGLYGTVVARNDDDTVLLSIAPGVEVRWAVAALRDVTSLPERYHKPDSVEGAQQLSDEPSDRPDGP